jgi:predicted  nucleic acid-binding Zn-ribbon protein
MSGVVDLEELSQRLTKVETKVEEHSRSIASQSEKNDTLTRLTTLVEMQTEFNKEYKIELQKFSTVIEKVNNNLTNLNNRQEQLNNSQQQLGQRVDNIENTLQDQKIDPMTMFKSILTYAATGIGSIIIAYLLYRFGISGGIQH